MSNHYYRASLSKLILVAFLATAAAEIHATATTGLGYDVLAGAGSDAGAFYGTYNRRLDLRDASGGLPASVSPQDFSFNTSVSGTSTLMNSGHTFGIANSQASVDASALISMGVMRAKVAGTAKTDIGLFAGQLGFSGAGENLYAAVSRSRITGETHDTLTFESATLPVGTPIKVEIDISFHAKAGVIGWPDLCATNCDPFLAQLKQVLPYASLGFNGRDFVHSVTSWGEVQEATYVESIVYDRTVGGSLPLNSFLTVQGGMNAYSPTGDITFSPRTALDTSGFADASSTAILAVRILTPGVGYTADSGVIYRESLPVPEPNTGALCIAGLAAIGAYIFRLRR